MINIKKLILKYKYSFLLIIFLIIIISIINAFLPYIIKNIIAITNNINKFNIISRKVIFLVLCYLFVTIISSFLDYIKSILLAKNTQNLIYDLRKVSYERIINFNMETFSNIHMSSLITRLTMDITNISEFIGKTIPMFLSSSIFLIVILVVMCFINIYFALVMIVSSILLVLTIIFIGKKMSKYNKKEMEINENITHFFGETFSSIKILHLFGIQKERRKILSNLNEEELNTSIKYFCTQSFLTPAKSISRYLIIFTILYLCLCSKLAIMDISIIYLVVSYVDKFFEPLGNMMYHYEDIQKGKVSLSRINNLINNDRNIENIYTGDIPEKLLGNIKFVNVNFSYCKGKKILNNINFSINKGEKIALIGKTGSGKTTIVNLLLGFYKIDSGNIFFDGKNIDDLSLESIRNNISFIQQNPFIFKDTIKKNIVLNNDNITDDKIYEVLKQVGLYDKVSKFKNGIYESINNNTFSKGEKQLISFARSLIKETCIYIFDEPTSNIDDESEEKIKKVINEVLNEATVIIISHKNKTIKLVDKIFEINDKSLIQKYTNI